MRRRVVDGGGTTWTEVATAGAADLAAFGKWVRRTAKQLAAEQARCTPVKAKSNVGSSGDCTSAGPAFPERETRCFTPTAHRPVSVAVSFDARSDTVSEDPPKSANLRDQAKSLRRGLLRTPPDQDRTTRNA